MSMMGHPMDEIRVQLKGYNDPSNMINLRGIGGSLMNNQGIEAKLEVRLESRGAHNTIRLPSRL